MKIVETRKQKQKRLAKRAPPLDPQYASVLEAVERKLYGDETVSLSLQVGHIYRNTKTGVIASYVGENVVGDGPLESGRARDPSKSKFHGHHFQNMADGSVFVSNELGEWEHAGRVE